MRRPGAARGVRWSGLASILAATGGLLSGACTSAPSELTADHAAAIRDSVGAALIEFARLSASARWDSLGMMYSDDPGFRFYENGGLQYESVDAVREVLSSLPAGTTISTEYRDADIRPLAPGLAVVGALFESTFADDAGSGFRFSGAVTMVWVHEPGGWKILSGHSSAPVPRGG